MYGKKPEHEEQYRQLFLTFVGTHAAQLGPCSR
jgi:hypothetical protein